LKYWLLVVFLLATAQCLSQDVDYRIEEALNGLRREALIRGVIYDTLLKNAQYNGYAVKIKGVRLVDSLPNEGDVNPGARTFFVPNRDHYITEILIEKHCLEDRLALENLIAHEYGHALGLVHSNQIDGDIMFEYIIYGGHGMHYDLYYKSEYRKVRYDNYFNRLKELYPQYYTTNLNLQQHDR
jgi:hypothetical protein